MESQQSRLILTVVLCVIVLVTWQAFFGPKPRGAYGLDGGLVPDGGAALAAPGAVGGPAVPPSAGPDAGATTAQALPATRPPEQIEALKTPRIDVELSSWGAGMKHAVLLGDRMRRSVEGKDVQVDLVQVRANDELPLTTRLSGVAVPPDAAYEVARSGDVLSFTLNTPEARVVKTFALRGDVYSLDLRVDVTNTAKEPRALAMSVLYPTWVSPQQGSGGGFFGRMFAPRQNVTTATCRAGTKTERWRYDKDHPFKEYPAPVSWTGIDERYFLAAVVAREPATAACSVSADVAGEYLARLDDSLGTVNPGTTVSRVYTVFLGPKSLDELGAASRAKPAFSVPPGPAVDLPESVDFSVWAVICRLLLAVMKFFQSFVGNWAIAIILLTVLVKIILFPLTYRQMLSMEGMRKLQPKMEEIRKKFAEDRERMNMEMMKLYQEHKVNPLGGCFPLLLQMPIWWALYQTLLSSFELYRSSFLWIPDLTAADAYYILPAAMGITMFVTQKMQPVAGDPTQAKILLYFMPIFFTFIMLNLPSGLTLYIFTNNLLSIAQQWYLRKRVSGKSAPVAAKPAKA